VEKLGTESTLKARGLDYCALLNEIILTLITGEDKHLIKCIVLTSVLSFTEQLKVIKQIETKKLQIKVTSLKN